MVQRILPPPGRFRRYIFERLIHVLQPDYKSHAARDNWTVHEAACLLARLEPTPVAELDGLYNACTETGGQALEYVPETEYKPSKLMKKEIERNQPDHPQFEPIRLFEAVPCVKPNDEVACDEWLAALVPEFVKRYRAKVNYEGIMFRARLKELVRQTQPLVDPGQVVASAFSQGADVPVELLCVAARHAEPSPHNRTEEDSNSEQPGNDPKPKRGHSEDFRSIAWDGNQFSLTVKQAAVVQVLWEAMDSGTPELSEETLKQRAGIAESTRLRDTFRRLQPNWRILIASGTRKGTFRLNV